MKTTALRLLVSSVGILMLQQTQTLRAQTVVCNSTMDFSISNGNPNGVWSYGWMPTDFSTYNPYTIAENRWMGPAWSEVSGDEPVIWKNTTENTNWGVPPGWLSLHPGDGQEPSVLRWIAPIAGPVEVEGQFLPGDIGIMEVAVRLNNQPWWYASDSGSFTLHTNVVAGNTIDFVVYGGWAYGNTPLSVLISAGPPFRLSLVSDGTTNTVSFNAPTNGTYVMQFTDNLTLPIVWMDISTNSLSADQAFSFTDWPTNESGFYRAKLD